MDYKVQAEQRLHASGFNKYELPDITEISLPDADCCVKMCAFLQAVKNPYLFRVGDVGVHIVFSGKDGDTLQNRISNLVSKSI